MIKGDIDQMKLKMNSEEFKSLCICHTDKAPINIIGKRYFITCINVKQERYESNNKDRVLDVIVHLQKKGY